MTSSRTRSCLLAIAGLVLVGCGSNAPATPEPTGSADLAALTLRIGTDDEPGVPAANAIEEFARQVDERSGGHIVIEPVWHAAGEDPDDWDQAVARMVVAGELDLGLIPSRAWDTEGVNSLRALNAPFLVTSKAVVDEIVTGDVSEELLGGLDEIGIVGLALLPEGFRHVFWWEQPLLTPDDFAGVSIRAPRSDTTYALLEALGAKPDDLVVGGFDAGVADGSVAGAESSFALATGLPGSWTTTAGNVTLFPKINSLVVNASALAALSPEQREIIAAAAEATRDWAVASSTDDAAGAETFCTAGGTVVEADQAQVESLVVASRPVYEELERDETTKRLISEIRTLAEDAPPPARVAPCQPDRADGAGAETPFAPVGDEPVTMAVNTQILTGLSDSPVLEASGPLASCTNVLDDGASVSHPDPDTDVFRGDKRVVCDGGEVVIEYEATMSRAAVGHTTGTWLIVSSTLSGVTGGNGQLVGDGDACETLAGSEGCILDMFTGTVAG